MTEVFPDDVAENLANNSLLAVDLGQLTIRSDNSEITFEQLLSKFEFQFNNCLLPCIIDDLDQNTPRLPAIEDEDVRR
jgi:hypothetical protein